jgi:hypothetical protein
MNLFFSRFNFKMSGANGVTDHPGAASVEAMDTSDASNHISSSTSSRITVKPTTNNKQQSTKPMSPGMILSFISNCR